MNRFLTILNRYNLTALAKTSVWIGLSVIVLFSLFALTRPDPTQTLIITNTASFDRLNTIVTLSRNDLGSISDTWFPVVKKQHKVFVSQTVDKNADGRWDDLLIEVSLPARSSDTLQLTWLTKKPVSTVETRTNVWLSLRSDTNTPSPEINFAEHERGFIQNIAKPVFQMEGPGIENDKVAFRAFFDNRNGKDIYGKVVETPVLDQVGVGASWHTMQPWGMDVLKVGNSLGAGGLAVQENGEIYRLGDADKATFRTLYEGPLQAAFQLRFTNWDVATGKRNGSETVSITKGDFYYKNDVSLALTDAQKLVAGIANFGIDTVVYKKHNAAFSSVSIYGKQAEGTGTKLGLAILFSTDDYVENKTTTPSSPISNTSYVALKPSKSPQNTIYFFACWEKTNSLFSTQQGFADYLQKTAQALAYPLQATISHKLNQ